MARKISVMTGQITDAAFELTRQEGFEGLSARRLANQIGCSTQPIFRAYRSMDDLYDEIYMRVIRHFSDFFNAFPKTRELPFVDLGLAYIAYAREEKQFFRILFLQEKRCGMSLYELLNGAEGNLVKEINRAADLGVHEPSELFIKIWMVIHGAACMAVTNDYDLDDAQTVRLLTESYRANCINQSYTG